MIVIVAGDVTKRFISFHNFFLQFEHFGFACIGEDLFMALEQEVVDSLQPIHLEPLVYLYIAGNC
jgi:hypothetical protein